MDFRKVLEKEHSKKLTTKIVMEICKHPEKMGELVDLLLKGPSRIKQRAAWPVSFVAERKPQLLIPYLPKLVDEIKDKKNHPAVLRNILRALQYVKEIPENSKGKTLTYCFELLNCNNQSIAVKVFSMTVLYNLSKEYPEIRQELKLSIEEQMEHGSTGVKSRGSRIIKYIS